MINNPFSLSAAPNPQINNPFLNPNLKTTFNTNNNTSSNIPSAFNNNNNNYNNPFSIPSISNPFTQNQQTTNFNPFSTNNTGIFKQNHPIPNSNMSFNNPFSISENSNFPNNNNNNSNNNNSNNNNNQLKSNSPFSFINSSPNIQNPFLTNNINNNQNGPDTTKNFPSGNPNTNINTNPFLTNNLNSNPFQLNNNSNNTNPFLTNNTNLNLNNASSNSSNPFQLNKTNPINPFITINNYNTNTNTNPFQTNITNDNNNNINPFQTNNFLNNNNPTSNSSNNRFNPFQINGINNNPFNLNNTSNNMQINSNSANSFNPFITNNNNNVTNTNINQNPFLSNNQNYNRFQINSPFSNNNNTIQQSNITTNGFSNNLNTPQFGFIPNTNINLNLEAPPAINQTISNPFNLPSSPQNQGVLIPSYPQVINSIQSIPQQFLQQNINNFLNYSQLSTAQKTEDTLSLIKTYIKDGIQERIAEMNEQEKKSAKGKYELNQKYFKNKEGNIYSLQTELSNSNYRRKNYSSVIKRKQRKQLKELNEEENTQNLNKLFNNNNNQIINSAFKPKEISFKPLSSFSTSNTKKTPIKKVDNNTISQYEVVIIFESPIITVRKIKTQQFLNINLIKDEVLDVMRKNKKNYDENELILSINKREIPKNVDLIDLSNEVPSIDNNESHNNVKQITITVNFKKKQISFIREEENDEDSQINANNNISFYPKCTLYKTVPSIGNIIKMQRREIQKIKGFILYNNTAKITFIDEVDLSYVDLDDIAICENGTIKFKENENNKEIMQKLKVNVKIELFEMFIDEEDEQMIEIAKNFINSNFKIQNFKYNKNKGSIIFKVNLSNFL